MRTWENSVTSRPLHRATYEDLAVARDGLRAEILDGELVLSPRGVVAHARAQGAIFGDLFDAFDRGRTGPGGWYLLTEPELWLGTVAEPSSTVCVPDLAGWRLDRFDAASDVVGITRTPDWICEVVSRTSSRRDRVQKRVIYAQAGVPWYWLVHPLARTVEVLKLDQGAYVEAASHQVSGRVRLPPFQALPVELEDWWG